MAISTLLHSWITELALLWELALQLKVVLSVWKSSQFYSCLRKRLGFFPEEGAPEMIPKIPQYCLSLNLLSVLLYIPVPWKAPKDAVLQIFMIILKENNPVKRFSSFSCGKRLARKVAGFDAFLHPSLNSLPREKIWSGDGHQLRRISKRNRAWAMNGYWSWRWISTPSSTRGSVPLYISC